MSHGYHWHGARARRKLRRKRLKPVEAYTAKNNPLKVREWWTRMHPVISSFSYGKRVKRGRRRK
jgi:hypothetical protein